MWRATSRHLRVPRRSWLGSGVRPATRPSSRITSPSVVIHQMKRTRECVPDAEDRAGPCRSARQDRGRGRGEGDATTTGCGPTSSPDPVPPPPLSPDWHATDSPYVRVDEVAPDGTWVDVFIGRRWVAAIGCSPPSICPTTWRPAAFRSRAAMRSSAPCVSRTVTILVRDRADLPRADTRRARRGYGIGTPGRAHGPVLAWTVGEEAIPAPPGGHGKGERHRDPTVTSQQFGSSPRPTVTSGWAVISTMTCGTTVASCCATRPSTAVTVSTSA